MLRVHTLQKAHPSLSASKKEIVLDLETSGFSRATDIVFLAGLGTSTQSIQLLAESPCDERELLMQLFSLLDHQHLITYNGDGFDLPFLRARAQVHGLSVPSFYSDDLYAFLRPRRSLFRFPDLKLKTLEQQAGFLRTDALSGAEVAGLYLRFLKESNVERTPLRPASEDWEKDWTCRPPLSLLMLHNQEDVEGTIALHSSLRQWRQKLRTTLPLAAELQSVSVQGDLATATYETEAEAVPRMDWETSFGHLVWNDHTLMLTVPVHRIRRKQEIRLAAVSPQASKDHAETPLPVPFLTLQEPGGGVPANWHTLLQEVWSLC